MDDGDLARTRIAPAPFVLEELIIRVWQLHSEPASIRLTAHRQTRPMRAGLKGPLSQLVGPQGFPDFLSPARSVGDIDEAIDLVLSQPWHEVQGDLAAMFPAGPGTSWLRSLAEGDIEAQRSLGTSLRLYHDAMHLEEALASRGQYARADATQRMFEAGARGLGSMIDGLPGVQWREPVVEVDTKTSWDVHTGGRGLLILPSVYAKRPMVGGSADQTVLVYPVPVPDPPVDLSRRPLARLIGRSRAAVLRAVRSGATTTELALRASISVASASEHAAVLRAAELLATVRTGQSVQHTLTPLGEALLASDID